MHKANRDLASHHLPRPGVKRSTRLAALAVGVLALPALLNVAGSGAGAASKASVFATASKSGSSATLNYLGTTRPTSSSTGGSLVAGPNETAPQLAADTQIPRSGTTYHVPGAGVPGPTGLPVSTSASGFSGLDAIAQRTASNGNQFSLEPPDQGLCVGGGAVVEAVNDVFGVYHTSGQPILSAPVAMNSFFDLAPAITRTSPPSFGPFLSDPKCYFDVATGRFILSELELSVDPATGNFGTTSAVLIAVSRSSDPTGSWNIFSLDTTDGNGSLSGHPNCPCFGDQPLIGADANGFYVSTNEFPISVAGFNGAQVYAFSKTALESSAGGTITGVHINAGAIAAPSAGIWYSVQPATSPGTTFATSNGGTEYFLSALQFSGTIDNRIAAWELTNTSSLNSKSPSLALSVSVISSEVYGQPPGAFQKSGPAPLADAVHDPLSLLASNDDRMNQVVFAHGALWSAVNSVVQTQNGPTRVGAAYFVVSPASGGSFAPAVVSQGYVSVNNENVLFPSIGVTDKGKAAMVFTVVGPDFFPSAGYTTFSTSSAPTAITISGAGQGPEDGFTAYKLYGGSGTARWGDYSAAVASGSTIWMSTEYIPRSCPSLPPPGEVTNGCRTVLMNWGTFVSSVSG